MELKRIIAGDFFAPEKIPMARRSFAIEDYLEKDQIQGQHFHLLWATKAKSKRFLVSLPAKNLNLKIYKNCNFMACSTWRGNYSNNFFERPQTKSKMRPESPEFRISLKKSCGSLKLLDLKKCKYGSNKKWTRFRQATYWQTRSTSVTTIFSNNSKSIRKRIKNKKKRISSDWETQIS